MRRRTTPTLSGTNYLEFVCNKDHGTEFEKKTKITPER